jgi:hypothetical protein
MGDDDIIEAWADSSPSWASGDGYYQAARAVLGGTYANAAPETVDRALYAATSRLTSEQAENFWSALGNLAKKAAPIAAQVLPIAAPIVGTVIGGPAGTAIGSAVGNLAGQALGGAGGPRLPGPAAMAALPLGGAPAIPGTPMPQSLASAGGTATGGGIAAQLMSFIQNPAFLQSLLGQVAGGSAAGTVPVGAQGAPAPFGAFMNALSVLANHAASESAEAFGESLAETNDDVPAYMLDWSGRLRGDPASPESRAFVLVEQLRESTWAQPSMSDGASRWLMQSGVFA